jgi:hypothetical protein
LLPGSVESGLSSSDIAHIVEIRIFFLTEGSQALLIPNKMAIDYLIELGNAIVVWRVAREEM